jgi:hypothetical protein
LQSDIAVCDIYVVSGISAINIKPVINGKITGMLRDRIL